MFRRRHHVLEVLLVHPGGPFWARREEASWSIPKGGVERGEDPLAAAEREFREETGLIPSAPFVALTAIKQRGGKTVHAWAFEGDCDPAAVRSNTFLLEWPPRSGIMREFPEVDRAGWFPVDEAKRKLIKAQAAFVDELDHILNTAR